MTGQFAHQFVHRFAGSPLLVTSQHSHPLPFVLSNTLSSPSLHSLSSHPTEKHDPNAFRDIILLGINEIIAPQSGQINAKDLQAEAGHSESNSVTENSRSATEEVVVSSAQDQEVDAGEAVSDNGNGSTVADDEETSSTGGQTDDANQLNSAECVESNGETVRPPSDSDTNPASVELNNREIVIDQAHFEALSKFLDVSGSKLNYRRYGEVLLDILIAGGTLGRFDYSLCTTVHLAGLWPLTNSPSTRKTRLLTDSSSSPPASTSSWWFDRQELRSDQAIEDRPLPVLNLRE